MRLIVVLLVGLTTGYFGAIEVAKFFNVAKQADSGEVLVTASGTAEWFYQNDTPLDVERFGTPENPKGLDIIPLENRDIDKVDHSSYDNLQDGMIFSFDRKDVQGSFELKVTNLTPLDAITSQDKAEGYATFQSPAGENFRVVLTGLFPGSVPAQTFGGVGFNHLIHGHTGIGTDRIFSEFAYIIVFGLADIYKEGKLIASDKLLYIAASQRARVLNEDFEEFRYNLEDPTGKMILHFVVLPHTLSPTKDYFIPDPVPTGFIGPDGEEQTFFHINFLENIEIIGNRFFDNKTWMGL